MNQPPLVMPGQSWRDLPEQAQQSAREYFENREIEKLPGDVVHLFDLVDKQRKEIALQTRANLLLNAELEKYHRSLLTNWIATVVQVLAFITALVKVFWLK